MDMPDFIQYLRQFGRLTPEDVAAIREVTRAVSLPKDTRFMEAATIPRELCFVLEGVTRVYYYTEAGKEVTKYFIDEGNVSVDASNYLYRLPTMAYCETVTDCRMLCISRDAFDKLADRISGWNELFLRLLAHGMSEKVNRISPMLAETAEERYLNFQERFPGVHNRIPQHLLASYIGVTKSSLSRIRRQVMVAEKDASTAD